MEQNSYRFLKIEGTKESVLSVSLEDILCCIKHGEDYTWKVLWLEATGPSNMLELENSINKQNQGFSISWDDIRQLASSFDQEIEVLLIGGEDITSLNRLVSQEKLREHSRFYIELIDSSYWEITSNEPSFIEALKHNLIGVSECSPDTQ